MASWVLLVIGWLQLRHSTVIQGPESQWHSCNIAAYLSFTFCCSNANSILFNSSVQAYYIPVCDVPTTLNIILNACSLYIISWGDCSMTFHYSKVNILLCIKLIVSRCMIAALHNKHVNFTCFKDTDLGKNIALLKMVKATGNPPIWYPAYAPGSQWNGWHVFQQNLTVI